MRKRTILAAITLFCLTPLVTSNAPVQAAPKDVPPIALTNPHIPMAVIDRLPEKLKNEPRIYIDPSIKVDTPLLNLDGSIVEGQSPELQKAAASCQKAIIIIGTQLDYGPKIDGRCGHIGWNESAQKTYNFWRDPYSNGAACFLVRGYSPNEIWFTAGCNTGGNSNVTVNWGMVASVPSVKGKNVSPPIGWAGMFE